jgi:pilus assembly protein CpaB
VGGFNKWMRQMKARDLFIIMLALVVSVAVAVGTRYILRGGSETTANVTKIMVASGDLRVGTRLDKSSFRWQEWPTGTLQASYITEKNKQMAEELVGSMIKQHVTAGEPILKANLAGEKAGYLSAMIGNNQRAFTIPLDNRSNISGKVLPEDYVDVIVASKEKSTQGYVANTVVRKVKVLEINGNLDPNEAEDTAKPKAQSITLQVSPKQAELLAAALREGSPVISLHSMTSDESGAPEQEEKEKPVEDIVTMVRGNDVQKIQMKN